MKYTYMIKKNKHELLVIEERSHDKPYHIYIIDNSPSLEYDKNIEFEMNFEEHKISTSRIRIQRFIEFYFPELSI